MGKLIFDLCKLIFDLWSLKINSNLMSLLRISLRLGEENAANLDNVHLKISEIWKKIIHRTYFLVNFAVESCSRTVLITITEMLLSRTWMSELDDPRAFTITKTTLCILHSVCDQRSKCLTIPDLIVFLSKILNEPVFPDSFSGITSWFGSFGLSEMKYRRYFVIRSIWC